MSAPRPPHEAHVAICLTVTLPSRRLVVRWPVPAQGSQRRGAVPGLAPEPPWLRARLEAGDPSAVVSELALSRGHPLCTKALELFVSIYGAEAGNLALKALAVGGVLVGGGIAPKIKAGLADGAFVSAFRDKGRYRDLLGAIPIHLVLTPRAPLLGAAQVARGLLRGR